jgi:hypothetical protein
VIRRNSQKIWDDSLTFGGSDGLLVGISGLGLDSAYSGTWEIFELLGVLSGKMAAGASSISTSDAGSWISGSTTSGLA